MRVRVRSVYPMLLLFTREPAVDLTLAARADPDEVYAELVVRLAPYPAQCIHVRVLLYASRAGRVLRRYKLTLSVFDRRPTEGLVECLRKVESMEEFDHHALRVDTGRPARERGVCRAALARLVRVKQAMFAKIYFRS